MIGVAVYPVVLDEKGLRRNYTSKWLVYQLILTRHTGMVGVGGRRGLRISCRTAAPISCSTTEFHTVKFTEVHGLHSLAAAL